MSRRYLLVQVCSRQPVTGDQFAEALATSILKHFGRVGLSRIDPKLIRFDSHASKAIVSCAKNSTDEMQAALALCQIYGSESSAVSLKVSGTIKGLRRS